MWKHKVTDSGFGPSGVDRLKASTAGMYDSVARVELGRPATVYAAAPAGGVLQQSNATGARVPQSTGYRRSVSPGFNEELSKASPQQSMEDNTGETEYKHRYTYGERAALGSPHASTG